MKTIYLVPHTHYDVAWAFTKEDSIHIMELMFKKVMELLRKTTNYKFIIEQIYLLKEIEKRDPELWAGLKEMIQKGRIEIVDGQYLMADQMLPHGEVLVRNIHHGKIYCKEKFNVDVPVAWAADGFGLNAQMPQIYKKSGYRWVAFRRGAPKRVSEFFWKGLDGTSILAHWMALGYRAALVLNDLEYSYSTIENLSATSNILMPSGSGSTFPLEETSAFVDSWNKKHQDKIKIATPSEFFSAVEEEKSNFSFLSGEIYSRRYSEVFPDAGSSRIWIINLAKKYEILLLNAEKSSALAWLFGLKYPQKELNEAWEKMFIVSFHDIINGSGIDEIFQDIREIFEYFENSLNKILMDSLSHISEQINTAGPSIATFNLLSWQVTNNVENEIALEKGKFKNPALIENDREIPYELSEVERYDDGSMKRAKISFIATVPSIGYKIYEIVEGRKSFEKKISISGNEIVNEFYRIKINPENGIIEVRDLKDNLIFEGNEIVIEDEIGDLYFHNSRRNEPIKTETGEGNFFGIFKPKSLKIEGDFLKAKIVFETEYYSITWPYRFREKHRPILYRQKLLEIRKEVILYHGLPRIEFVTNIKNNFPNVRIRVRFKTPIKSSNYSRETQFGVIRETVERAIYPKLKIRSPARAPCIHWINYFDKEKGLALINRGNTENDIYKNAIYMTLLRSVNFLSADGISGPWIPTPDALELKEYTFKYAIYPYRGNHVNANVHKQAHEYTNPLTSIYANTKGKISKEYSFFKINSDSLVVSAIKKAEKDDSLILRFYETKGKKLNVEIEPFKEVKDVYYTDLLEQEETRIELEESKIKMSVKPYEIVSLKFRF